MGVLAHEVAVGVDTDGGVSRRHDSSCSYPGFDSPGPEVLHGPLGQVLTLRYFMYRGFFLNHDCRDVPLTELDGKPETDRAPTHNYDLAT